MIKKSALCLSLSLIFLTACESPAPVQPTPEPTPTPAPTQLPVFQGETTLSGTVALDAQSVVVEASNASGSFRQAVNANNRNYRIAGVPVGERIRVQAQYVNNPNVILSALVDVAQEQREQNTALNIDLESTALDLIYRRAAADGRTALVNTPVASLRELASVQSYRAQVLQVLQEIFTRPIDAILVPVQEAPAVVSALNVAVPAIDAILQNQPVPQPSGTPSPQPTTQPSTSPTVSPGFVPTRLLIKPGNDLTIAKDTELKLWVTGVDDQNNQQAITPSWSAVSATGQASIDSSGVFRPSSPGTFRYLARLGNLSQEVTIRVTDGELDSLEILPNNDFTLNVGQPFELLARGRDTLANEVTVTPTWELSNNFVGTVNTDGVFNPLQPGRVDVTARARSFSASLNITVESASTFQIEFSPSQPTILTGRSQPIQVLGLDPSNNNVASNFNFSVLDSSIGSFVSGDASINGIVPSAVFQALKPGTTQISVRDIFSNRTSTFPITVADNVPYISGMSPANTPLTPGQTVTLLGENFSPVASANQVRFNGVSANVLSATSTSLNVTVPIGAFTGFVNITTDGQRGNGFPFVITPRLNSIFPSEANEGDIITLTGDHFSTDNPAHNTVFFGSTQASAPLNVSNSSLQVRVPGNLNSDINVVVRVKGQLSNSQPFQPAGASIPVWSEQAAAPSTRSGAKARIISGNIYLVGSYDSGDSRRLEIYSISNNSWSTGASLATDRAGLASAVLDDRLYVFGGSGDSRRVDRYIPADNTWVQLDNNNEDERMEFGREGAVAEVYNSRIYLIGGRSSTGRVVEEYNPGTNKWTQKQSSPNRHFESASAMYNGRIYVIGGGEDIAEDRITAYDVEDDRWIVGLTPMPKRLRKASAVLLQNKIYVVGGEDETGAISDAVYEYDPTQNSWRTLRRLPSPRSGAAVAGISSRLHVIGGRNNQSQQTGNNFRGNL